MSLGYTHHYAYQEKLLYSIWNIPFIVNLYEMETLDMNANLRLIHILFRIQVFSRKQHKWTNRFTSIASLSKPLCNGPTLICNPTLNYLFVLFYEPARENRATSLDYFCR